VSVPQRRGPCHRSKKHARNEYGPRRCPQWFRADVQGRVRLDEPDLPFDRTPMVDRNLSDETSWEQPNGSGPGRRFARGVQNGHPDGRPGGLSLRLARVGTDVACCRGPVGPVPVSRPNRGDGGQRAFRQWGALGQWGAPVPRLERKAELRRVVRYRTVEMPRAPRREDAFGTKVGPPEKMDSNDVQERLRGANLRSLLLAPKGADEA
jgi:hypothetical protein